MSNTYDYYRFNLELRQVLEIDTFKQECTHIYGNWNRSRNTSRLGKAHTILFDNQLSKNQFTIHSLNIFKNHCSSPIKSPRKQAIQDGYFLHKFWKNSPNTTNHKKYASQTTMPIQNSTHTPHLNNTLSSM